PRPTHRRSAGAADRPRGRAVSPESGKAADRAAARLSSAMDLVHELPDYEYVMRGADGRSAVVNDRRLVASFIVSANRLIEDWEAAPVASLDPEQLEPLLALDPEVIIIGT